MTDSYYEEVSEAFGFDRADAIREAYGDPCRRHGYLRYGGDCPHCELEAEEITITLVPVAPEPVTCPVCGSETLCTDGCPAFILNDWIAEQVAKADYNNQFSL